MLAVAAALMFFVADLLLPRGATPAIGYAIVPVLVGSSRKRSVIIAITAFCTVLAWAGFFLEPAGAAWWTSAFDRLMVSIVLWLALLLVWRRLTLIAALAERTRALEDASEELSRSNEELDRFASVVAHDLRGPLNGIGLVAKVLTQTGRETFDPESKEWLASIEREIDSMNRLIERLLSYGRVGCGAVRLASCDCESTLLDVTRSLAGSLEKSGATVSHDPLPVVRADPVLIAELLQNLIENAVKYRSDQPPRVHLSATRGDNEVVFVVRDNGIGINDADRAAIFRPFTQLARTSGVGLGLATCKRIVQRHGGRIWVDSEAGHGSTFFFAIPAAANAQLA